MTLETLTLLGHYTPSPTPTFIELVDRSKFKPKGVLEDVTISLDSWEYLSNLCLVDKIKLSWTTLDVRMTWQAVVDGFINCRLFNITRSHDEETEQIILHPL